MKPDLKRSLPTRIADRLILKPSRNPIDPEGRRRERIETPHGIVEAWVLSNQTTAETPHFNQPAIFTLQAGDLNYTASPVLIALKFPGTAGRAERGGPHPFELVRRCMTEIWTINPLGYGGSDGKASLNTHAATLDAIWQHLRERHPQLPVALIGNSLGCLSALYLAARHDVAGVYLRNPVPVKQMMERRLRYNWWNLGLARWLARHLPAELDAVTNAHLATAELFMVSSERDRVCPWKFQSQIWEAYGGPKKRFMMEGAQHHDRVPDSQSKDYQRVVLDYLKKVVPEN